MGENTRKTFQKDGLGTTHSTHGILIQEVCAKHMEAPEEIYLPRKTMPGVKYTPKPLLLCFSKKRVEPVMPQILSKSLVECRSAARLSADELLWKISRARHNKEYTVPHWSGWLSVMADHT